MYGYIYITTNKINGRKYIGQHKANTTNDSYLGSGTGLRNAIKKHGKKNFEKEIIKIAENADHLNELEVFYIEKYNSVLDRNFYNQKNGGFSYPIGLCGQKKSPETRRKISEAKKGINNHTPESIAKMVAKRKSQIAMGIGVPPPANRGNRDFRHTEETKKHQRELAIKLHKKKKKENGSYWSDEGRLSSSKKAKQQCANEEKLKIHSDRIKQGRENAIRRRKENGVETKSIIWFHDQNKPTNRIKISVVNGQYDIDAIPLDWIRGFGPKGKRTGPAPKALCKPCRIDDIEYSSAAEAGRCLGIHPDTVLFRLKNTKEKWKTWIKL
jgi:group I intron endonuclease